MLKIFRKPPQANRHQAFLDLLFRVLRELANPVPPARLAQQRSFASRPAHPERNFPMNVPIGTNHYPPDANLPMFTPLNPEGARGMSRSSLAVAILVNVMVLLVLGIQVHNRVVSEPPRVVTLFAPTEPEPVAPKFLHRVLPPATAQPEPLVILHRTAALPAPPTPAPILHHDLPAISLTALSAPHVTSTTAAPAVHTVALMTAPVSMQPTGLVATTVNLTRATTPTTGGAPGAAKVTLAGTNGPSGHASAAIAGPIYLTTCSGCQPGDLHSPGITRRVEAIPFPKGPEPEVKPAIAVAHNPAHSYPTVLFKPRPAYTPEATALHIEGEVKVKIHVSADGAVTILGIVSGLGHGLDESATQCAQGIRFKPAVDSSGQPMDWEGLVTITFQMS